MRIEELKGKTINEARAELEKHTVSELKALCREHGAKGCSRATKIRLVDKVIDIATYGLWYRDCTMNCVRGKYTGGKHNGRS